MRSFPDNSEPCLPRTFDRSHPSPRSRPSCIGWLVAGLIVTLASAVHAANLQLRADVQPVALRSRTNAPAFIDVRINSRQSSILTGTLELQVMSGNEVVYRQQTPEIALPPGVTTQRVFLPSIVDSRATGVDAQLRFVSRQGTVDLGRFQVAGESLVGRQYLIGVCGSGSSTPQGQVRVWQALRPERLFTESKGGSAWQVNTLPVWITPEDLPSAIGLCAFDAIAIEGVAFAALGEKELASLTTWVEAGGSLCIVPRAPLDKEHVSFLNGLAGKKSAPEPVSVLPGGPLTINGGPVLMRHAGMGRVVVALNPPSDEAEMNADAWRQAAAFLAKAGAGSISRKETLLAIDVPAALKRDRYADNPGHAGSEMERILFQRLPNSSRMIPLSVVATLLGSFVLLIGPGEWMVLGWLRRRRWTWITFPVFATGFAWLAVRTGEHYLGRDDKRVTLVITDVGAQGRVLRENRLELRVAGRDMTADSEVRQSVSLPVRFWNSGSNYSDGQSIPLYQGQVPGHYTLHQPLQQWKPVLQRTMSFPGGHAAAGIQWPEIDAREFDRGRSAQSFFEREIGDGWGVNVFHLGSNSGNRGRYGPPELSQALSYLHVSRAAEWAAMISPSGNANLLDLALYDSSDAKEWLVVATKNTENGIHVIRRIYRTDD